MPNAKKMTSKQVKKLTQIKPLVCPYCEKPIERFEWRTHENGLVGMIGCASCFKVLGANINI